jgi:hypothetical protein
MLKFKMDNPSGGAMVESLGDYSIHYGKMSGGYPQSIASNLDKYAVVKFQ